MGDVVEQGLLFVAVLVSLLFISVEVSCEWGEKDRLFAPIATYNLHVLVRILSFQASL